MAERMLLLLQRSCLTDGETVIQQKSDLLEHYFVKIPVFQFLPLLPLHPPLRDLWGSDGSLFLGTDDVVVLHSLNQVPLGSGFKE